MEAAYFFTDHGRFFCWWCLDLKASCPSMRRQKAPRSRPPPPLGLPPAFFFFFFTPDFAAFSDDDDDEDDGGGGASAAIAASSAGRRTPWLCSWCPHLHVQWPQPVRRGGAMAAAAATTGGPRRGAAPQIAHPRTIYPIAGSEADLAPAARIDMDRSTDDRCLCSTGYPFLIPAAETAAALPSPSPSPSPPLLGSIIAMTSPLCCCCCCEP